MMIPLDKIILNPEIAARVKLDENYITLLMKSLKSDGQLHQITVRPKPDGTYEIIDGFHRVEAAKRLGWKDIEARVISVDDLEARFLSLKANFVRKSLEPVEEGEVIYKIMQKHGLTEKQVAEKIGVSVKWVTERLSIVLKVSDEIKKLLTQGKITLGHAVLISKIEEPKKQVKFAQLIISKGLTVKQSEEALIEFLNDTIYTIGYAERTFEELTSLLAKNNIKVVLDIRHDTEFVKPEFSFELLKRQLPIQGIKYINLKELGVPKLIREPYITGNFSSDCFRQWYLWWIQQSRDVWEKTIRDLKRIGPIALMCYERYATPKKGQKHYCHRHFFAEYLLKEGFFEKREDIE